MDRKHTLLATTRRHFLHECALGLGRMALASLAGAPRLLSQDRLELPNPLAPKKPHFAPKAKRVIYLFMAGAPSQIDLFDYKPVMKEWYDKDLPDSIRQGQRLTTMTSGLVLMISRVNWRGDKPRRRSLRLGWQALSMTTSC